ncbi:hypothetical protein CH330_04175 [candidate division WOR-3 bacterium JGI_Cruoil_03_51_56]|uniref:Uncharacterized protein n=1 Tax=candidate division WOR-3 bacterium JGI_Cruoil_03_51_56 TaxID=1973747 RepID=A0A235BUE5_UNCW3|nr:MAG: hypothetical protein CH330_04175 [candidate division WOR-3 bacterium JGI_Cruoil_03_51_56]
MVKTLKISALKQLRLQLWIGKTLTAFRTKTKVEQACKQLVMKQPAPYNTDYTLFSLITTRHVKLRQL